MRRSLSNIARSLLLTLSASGLVACGSSETTPTGTGGSGGVGGSATTTGGTGGATAATTAATGTDGKLCPLPHALITDFTYIASGTTATEVHFGDSSTLSGGEYVYPTGTDNYPLISDVSASNWHITGTVGTYSGFGLYFDSCTRIDASAYKGISFKISGTVEQGGTVTFEIDTLNDTITATWLNSHKPTSATADTTAPGRCVPPASAVNQWAQSTCAEPQASIPVTDSPTVQSVLWTDFSEGAPDADVKNPSDIVGIHWFFPNPDSSSGSPTPYKVDITLDDLSFISQ